jgi:hypothetical protein
VPTVPENVVALFVSDLHLDEKPPVARSVEEDWPRVQAGYIRQLRDLQRAYRAPIFIAGDLLDKWNASPRTISLAIQWFKELVPEQDVFAIPGNHDLPHGNQSELFSSAFWTLVEAGAIKYIPPNTSVEVGNAIVWAWTEESVPPPKGNGLAINVALIHDFIWTKDTGHPTASNTKRWASWVQKLKGWDMAVFGDNHKGFLIQQDKTVSVLNCGTFIRRYQDERDYRPSVGVLFASGVMGRHFLDNKSDNFLNLDKQVLETLNRLDADTEALCQELTKLHSARLSYERAVRHWIDKQQIEEPVKKIMLRCLLGK